MYVYICIIHLLTRVNMIDLLQNATRRIKSNWSLLHAHAGGFDDKLSLCQIPHWS
jgi:hypothetical protein